MSITCLHIAQDNKFLFAIDEFKSDSRINNKIVIFTREPDYTPIFAKGNDYTFISGQEDRRRLLEQGEYDIVFFHSMNDMTWDVIKYIPADKIVIWWAWGWDLYDSIYGEQPLLKVGQFGPLTSKELRQLECTHPITYTKKILKKLLFSSKYSKLQLEGLNRIDYFQPVLEIELEMIKQKGFKKIKEFYYPNSWPKELEGIPSCKKNGNVLLGNSATYSNNHIDIFSELKAKNINSTYTYVLPVNYGDAGWDVIVKKKASEYAMNCQFIDTYIEYDKYMKIIEGCSYAIFGVLRQQAMGNIMECIKRNIKVFLYKDSMPYKSLKSMGFIVHAIEDIDSCSFEQPLTKEDYIVNCEANRRERLRRAAVYESAMTHIIELKG